MLSTNFKNVIKFIFERVKDKDIKWAFIGSANMSLQGIDIVPNDLDIITNPIDLKIFNEQFKRYIVKPISEKPPFKKGYPVFYELKLEIEGVNVHVLGEDDKDVYFGKVKRGDVVLVKLDNMNIPCLSLESEAKAYSETDREDKANLIRNYLSKEN